LCLNAPKPPDVPTEIIFYPEQGLGPWDHGVASALHVRDPKQPEGLLHPALLCPL
jgi:hypothetical protein